MRTQTKFSTSLVLLGITIILGVTRAGYLPVAGVGGAVTLMHIPAIIAGIMDGLLGGAVVGTAFGLISLLTFPPHDWLVQLVPRIFIGMAAGLVFRSTSQMTTSGSRISLAAALAALAGTLTNTLGVSLAAAARGYYPPDQLATMAVLHGSAEGLLAVLVAVPVAVSYWHSELRRR